jgi:hypothetical protein
VDAGAPWDEAKALHGPYPEGHRQGRGSSAIQSDDKTI